jgi:hypothetical protein
MSSGSSILAVGTDTCVSSLMGRAGVRMALRLRERHVTEHLKLLEIGSGKILRRERLGMRSSRQQTKRFNDHATASLL